MLWALIVSHDIIIHIRILFFQVKVKEFGIKEENMFVFWDVSVMNAIGERDLIMCVYSGLEVAIPCGLPLG